MDNGAAGSARGAPIGRLLFLAVVVALVAAFASYNCTRFATASEISAGDKTVASSVLFPVLLSTGIALAVGLLFLGQARSWPGAKLFATVGVASYAAGMVGAWWPLLVPAVISLIVVVAAGVFCYYIVRRDSLNASWLIAVISGVGISVGTFGFVAGFWANYEMMDLALDWSTNRDPARFDGMPFALIAGVVPPVAAAAAAWLCGKLCDFAGSENTTEPAESFRTVPSPSSSWASSMGTATALAVAVGLCGALHLAVWPLVFGSYATSGLMEVLVTGAALLAAGILLHRFTPDRREIWFFALVGLIACFPSRGLDILAAVILSILAAYVARSKFGAEWPFAGLLGIGFLIAVFGPLYVMDNFFLLAAYGLSGVPHAIASVAAARVAGILCRRFA